MSMGFVHSIEVGSFVDGPGTRDVVFLSGCPLHCLYCHNPDVCRVRGERTSAEKVVAQIARSAEFLRASGGGITLSGGEPLAQLEFAHDILRGAKALGLHTALDTSGYLGERVSDEMLDSVDLVLLDIKSFDPVTYREVTGVDIAPTLQFAERLARLCKPTWIRFVLVPGLTDDPTNVSDLAHFVAGLSNVERVEIIPFHQMARHRWKELGVEYRLSETEPPTDAQMDDARRLFDAEGVTTGVSHAAPCGPGPRHTEVHQA
jgi:pyruvate formate lyase activating enzyme